MDNSSLLQLAALNNAEWCDIVCSSHNVKGKFTDTIWLNSNQVPMYYPNAVTLKPVTDSGQFSAIEQLIGTRAGAWSIKDSFGNLDLLSLGFSKLFDAQWLLAPDISKETLNQSEIEVRVISNLDELNSWESAWGNGESRDLFNTSILSDERVRFIAAYKNEEIVAGAIANSSEGIIGISNVFYPSNPSLYWRNFLLIINQHFPGLPIVGYEHGEDLGAALEAGLKPVGSLTVWLLDK